MATEEAAARITGKLAGELTPEGKVYFAGYNFGYEAGYRAGLEAAAKAVEAVECTPDYPCYGIAADAIRALAADPPPAPAGQTREET